MKYLNFKNLNLLALSAFALLATACGILTDPGFIVFSTGDEGNRDIAIIRPDGTEFQIVVGHDTDDFAPVWSSDSRRIAYLSNRDGNVEVYVTLTIDSTGDYENELSLRVTNTGVDETEVIWSPDGTRLAYVSPDDLGNHHLYWVDLDSLRPNRLIFDKYSEIDPAWDPTGEWIAFSVLHSDGLSSGIFMRNPGGVNSIQVTQTEDYSPVWSPDGEKLAFVSRRDKNEEIYIVNVGTDGSFSQAINITNNPANDWSPSWSPDSKNVAFISDRGESPDIFIVSVGGGEATPLTSNSLNESNLSYGPSNSLVFNSDPNDRLDLFVLSIDSMEQKRLTKNNANNSQPDW